MREVIHDIVKHTNPFVEEVKLVGSAEETKVEAIDEDRVIFIKGKLNEPVADLQGDTGLSNLDMLDDLCSFASYKADNAKFVVERRERHDKEVAVGFNFIDGNGRGAKFRLLNADHVADQPVLTNFAWDIEFEPARSKVQEFTELARIFSDEKWFAALTNDDDLEFEIGDPKSATNTAAMVFHSGVNGGLRGDLLFPTQQVLGVFKLVANDPVKISLTSRGLLRLATESAFGTYDYYFPSKRR